MIKPVLVFSRERYKDLFLIKGYNFFIYKKLFKDLELIKLIYIDVYTGQTLWDIEMNKYSKRISLIFYIQDSIVLKETFINHIRKFYTEYFEWILFHPEWLA